MTLASVRHARSDTGARTVRTRRIQALADAEDAKKSPPNVGNFQKPSENSTKNCFEWSWKRRHGNIVKKRKSPTMHDARKVNRRESHPENDRHEIREIVEGRVKDTTGEIPIVVEDARNLLATLRRIEAVVESRRKGKKMAGKTRMSCREKKKNEMK
uniref:Uncharacterized protein n=1 Tax=Cacopsylla melanoneura TaxID=428564 RepID=A0A8D8YPF3_9HEMI